MNDNLNKEVITLPPFKRLCMTIGELPSSYVETMTYYESLLWFCNYLGKTVIPAINNNAEAVEELQTKYIELKDYVDNYFENLDVQQEINNKLDEMAESGELAEIIAQYLEVAAVLGFDTKADLKAADNLIDGSIARIIGLNTYNDGKGCYYKIRTLTSGDVIDDDQIIALTNYPTLIGEKIPTSNVSYVNLNALLEDSLLIANSVVSISGYYDACDGGDSIYFVREANENETANNITTYETTNGLIAEICDNSKELNVKKYGLKCDSSTDESTRLQALIDYAYNTNKSILLDGYVYVTNSIETKGVKIKGLGVPATVGLTYTSKEYGYIGFDYLRNQNNGALITFNDYVNDYLDTGSGIISDIANPILKVTSTTFDLENLTICGWIRNNTQEGIRNYWDTESTVTYIYGGHKFKDVNILNCGSNAMHLTNLETTTLNNVTVKTNFGYGIYIDGQTSIDTPTEYVRIENCDIDGNKLGGIYINKGFNKQLTLENCNLSANGLFNQLNISVPENIEDIPAGITINDYKNNQFTFEVDNCYAEQMNLLVKVNTEGSSHVFNNIKITNNVLYPVSSNSAIMYLNNYYNGQFIYYNNSNNNGNQLVKSDNVNEIIPLTCDKYALGVINNIPNITYHSNLNVTIEDIKRYGNLIYFRINATATANIAAWQTIISNFPKPQANTLMTLIHNGVTKYVSFFTNRNCSMSDAIASGDTLTFFGVYYVDPYSNRNGTY